VIVAGVEQLLVNHLLGCAEVGFSLALAAFPAEREDRFPAAILPETDGSLAGAASF
jgi:hypothetical protein